MGMQWITLASASAITLIASVAITYFAFQQPLKAVHRLMIVLVATAPFLIEAAVATINLKPEPLYGLRSAKITAQIYREAYKSTSPSGNGEEHPEGWYLRMGEEAPGKIETSVLAFKTEGADARFVPYTGTPAATMRASIKDMSTDPIQVCTGDCEGLATISDAELKGTEGIVVADWRRVQDVTIGQAAPSLAMDTVMPSGLPIGRWCLTIGLTLLATGALLALKQHVEDRMKGRRAKTTAARSSTGKTKAKGR